MMPRDSDSGGFGAVGGARTLGGLECPQGAEIGAVMTCGAGTRVTVGGRLRRWETRARL